MDDVTHEVKKRRMKVQHLVIMLFSVIVATIAYGHLLRGIEGSLPFIDAFSTVASVAAMIISIKMFAEQWLLWIVVDVVTVVMWAVAFANGNDSIATLIMWMIYLINAVIMQIKWTKEARDREV